MGKRLFVRNLPFSTNDDELREIFSRAGTIEPATVMMDRLPGRSRGFGFVEMATEDEAQRAIRELEGIEVGGRALSVSEARERGERPPYTPGGGGYRPVPNLGYGGSGFNDAPPRFPKEGGSRRGLRGKKRSLLESLAPPPPGRSGSVEPDHGRRKVLGATLLRTGRGQRAAQRADLLHHLADPDRRVLRD